MSFTDTACVLAVDDEVRSLETMARILGEEFEVVTAASAAEAETVLAEHNVQVLLCDQRMPGVTGVEFLAQVRERWPEVVRMVISGYTDAEDIISGINDAGIYQYITKPWQPDSLLLTVRNAVELYRLQRENELLSLDNRVSRPTLAGRVQQQKEHVRRSLHLDRIVRSADSPIEALCEQLSRVAPYDIPVLVAGESGTGKELIARALHYNSLRAERPFVVENCGALPDQLLESELFGHKRGSFTGAINDHIGLFEQADGGTIFLDEIGDVSPAFQVKLLRVLQEGEFRAVGSNQRRRIDVRVVAASNRDLQQEVRKGNFREDLYYRLAGVTLVVPPLRARIDDIPLLAKSILNASMVAFDKRVSGFTDEALTCLSAYHWPGNVRELQNEVQRLLIYADDEAIGANLLAGRILRALPGEKAIGKPAEKDTDPGLPAQASLKERVEAMELRLLRETMIRHRWNKSRAAQELGLSRVGLRSKLERYGLSNGATDRH